MCDQVAAAFLICNQFITEFLGGSQIVFGDTNDEHKITWPEKPDVI